jgi:hypothetical protein
MLLIADRQGVDNVWFVLIGDPIKAKKPPLDKDIIQRYE